MDRQHWSDQQGQGRGKQWHLKVTLYYHREIVRLSVFGGEEIACQGVGTPQSPSLNTRSMLEPENIAANFKHQTFLKKK